jgi:hypothetical protein
LARPQGLEVVEEVLEVVHEMQLQVTQPTKDKVEEAETMGVGVEALV